MEYSPEAFDALLDEVERQGGALQAERCVSEDVIFTSPPYTKRTVLKEFSCGCENDSRMVSVYDPIPRVRRNATGFIPACAVCDSMGQWPRYRDAVVAADPDMDNIE